MMGIPMQKRHPLLQFRRFCETGEGERGDEEFLANHDIIPLFPLNNNSSRMNGNEPS
jgi:hypothetical protein